MSQLHIRQISSFLKDRYGSTDWKDNLTEVNNYSRLLAKWSAELALNSTDSLNTHIEITDGGGDNGIDAIGINSDTSEIAFVQAKWRQNGSGGLKLDEVLKFLHGVRMTLGMSDTATTIARATPRLQRLIDDALQTPGTHIKIVTTTTATEANATPVQNPIDQLMEELNDLEDSDPIAEYIHFEQASLFSALAKPATPKPTFTLQLLDVGRSTEPHKMFYGRVNAADLAELYLDQGQKLFSDNIRLVLPRSDINDGILRTIRDTPEQFVFYNNGITILAEEIKSNPGSKVNHAVASLSLRNASIINGAQTVSTLARSNGPDHEENLGKAFVIVRCIEIPADSPEIGRNITRYANTQNEVSTQDFAFLDREQHRLSQELAVMRIAYVLRPGEKVSNAMFDSRIDVRDAATALACLDKNIEYAILAKREVSQLFSNERIYSSLFNPRTDALELLRSTRIVERISEISRTDNSFEDPLSRGIALHGRYVIAHQVLQEIGRSALRSPDDDSWTTSPVRERAFTLVEAMRRAFPTNAYPGNVFKNTERSRDLLASALAAHPQDSPMSR